MGSSRRILGTLGLLSCLALSANVPAAAVAAAAPPGPAAPAVREMPKVPFTQRYQAVQRGGLVRASNSSIACRRQEAPDAEPCAEVNRGAAGVNGDFDMFYSEVDKDPDTYNSTRAELRSRRVRRSRTPACTGAGTCGWVSRSRRRTTAGCWSPSRAGRTRRSSPTP